MCNYYKWDGNPILFRCLGHWVSGLWFHGDFVWFLSMSKNSSITIIDFISIKLLAPRYSRWLDSGCGSWYFIRGLYSMDFYVVLLLWKSTLTKYIVGRNNVYFPLWDDNWNFLVMFIISIYCLYSNSLLSNKNVATSHMTTVIF